MGEGTPSKSTRVPASVVAMLPLASSCAVASDAGPRLLPKMVTISPGVTPYPALSNCGLPRKLAALSTVKESGAPKYAVTSCWSSMVTGCCGVQPAKSPSHDRNCGLPRKLAALSTVKESGAPKYAVTSCWSSMVTDCCGVPPAKSPSHVRRAEPDLGTAVICT